MPVLAALARFVPLATLVLVAQLRRIDPLLLDASRVLPVSPIKTWLQIRLTMMAPGVVAAACVVFALSMGELGATLIVAPPGRATLTMRIYNYLHYGSSDVVAGLCLLMAVGAVSAGVIAILAMASWSRLLPQVFPRSE
jgi:iron(III) transport system permease protein